MSNQNSHANCVVLREADGDVPDALRDVLNQRRCRTEILRDSYHAFARLCLIERLESVRSAWGLQRSSPLCLVIDGDTHPQLAHDMLAARDRYLPSVGLLQWRDGELIELRPAASNVPSAPPSGHLQKVPAAQSAPSAHAGIEHSSGPSLHLVEPPEDDRRMRSQSSASREGGSNNGEGKSHGSNESLSPDEIRMLLVDQPSGLKHNTGGTPEPPSQQDGPHT